MTDQHAASRASVVLLVNRQEWIARSVESVLQPAGFAVVKAYTGRQAIELAARLRPDLVIVDFKLSDILGLEVCRAIRELPTVDDTTPFIIATAASLRRQERHECFRAGIWDIFSSPFDPVELVGKLEAFLSARRQVEHALESTHKDQATGLYNWNGLLARAVELVADAQRSRRWTACVAVGPRGGQTVVSSEEFVEDSSDEVLRISLSDTGSPRLLDRFAATLLEATRDSDSVGILGTDDFLVLAPGTGEEGAAVLATRPPGGHERPGHPQRAPAVRAAVFGRVLCRSRWNGGLTQSERSDRAEYRSSSSGSSWRPRIRNDSTVPPCLGVPSGPPVHLRRRIRLCNRNRRNTPAPAPERRR